VWRRWNRRQGRRPVPDLRRADHVAAPRPGRRRHHDLSRRATEPTQGCGPGAGCVSRAPHGAAHRPSRRRPCALPDGGQLGTVAGTAVLRQLALWHLSGAQRQSDQFRRAAASRFQIRSAPRQHRFRLRNPAQCVCPRVAIAGQVATASRGYFLGGAARASSLPGCVCRGGPDCQLRIVRVSRSVRHPPTGFWSPRYAARARVHGGVRKCGSGCAGLSDRAGCGTRRGDLHRPRG